MALKLSGNTALGVGVRGGTKAIKKNGNQDPERGSQSESSRGVCRENTGKKRGRKDGDRERNRMRDRNRMRGEGNHLTAPMRLCCTS